MKARIKFKKYGVLKFIGHLDVMRYFQKAFRRCGVDIAYSQGYNPHQLMSFAAPLGVGLTSDGEYLDVNLNSYSSPEEMITLLNTQMAEGIIITGFLPLDDSFKNSMSLVTAADYKVSLKDDYINSFISDSEQFREKFLSFINQDKIEIIKKSKKSENLVDIKPLILDVSFDNKSYEAGDSVAEQFNNNIFVYLKLATGSVDNLKPELVIQAFCEYFDMNYQKFAFQIHRIDVYSEKGSLERTL